MMMKPALQRLLPFCLALASLSAVADAEKECGTLYWNYGPIDYRKSHAQQRELVERPHFPYGVESLTKRATGPFGADLRYTLSVFPNHPRALMTMARLVAKEKRDPPEGAEYPLECWYERSLRFKPDDHIPRLLYVTFLLDRKRFDEARKHLDYVAESTKDDPFAQFNTGMLYADMKEYDKALVQAHRVMALGFERRELRERLTAAGHWADPPTEPTEAASAPASAASH